VQVILSSFYNCETASQYYTLEASAEDKKLCCSCLKSHFKFLAFKVNDKSCCRERGEVCGSDGLTYITPCALNEQSVLRDSSPDLPQLSMEYWGPCVEPPTIVSPPSDTYGPMGANLTLDCEARGYPAPIISWQYETVEGETIYLPSDDQDISIQMRGGPETNMVTGWAQISSLEPGYSGVYHCIAENTQGKVHARAVVGVYRKEL